MSHLPRHDEKSVTAPQGTSSATSVQDKDPFSPPLLKMISNHTVPQKIVHHKERQCRALLFSFED
jgi:predicted site-specific integrase-resolvase